MIQKIRGKYREMHASQITSFLFAFNQEDYSSRTITNERIDLIKKEKKVSKFCGQFSAPFFLLFAHVSDSDHFRAFQ